MKFYLAPLEGITGYVFRNAVHKLFGEGIEKYFTPFIEPHPQKKSITNRALNDISPDHNRGIYVVPQILTNNAESYMFAEREIMPYGYKELNLNLGCPSATVTTKHRGSGLLQELKMLDDMLKGIFAETESSVSVKTRIGFDSPDEWPAILDIYNKYPLKELIIHPRVRNEFYQGGLHYDAVRYALNNSDFPICYNGDINTKADYDRVMEILSEGDTRRLPDSVMIGRGMVRNPKLIRSMNKSADSKLTPQELKAFNDALTAGYSELLSGDVPVLHKMKEVWSWLILDIPNHEKLLKRITKAKRMSDYEEAVAEVMRSVL